MSSPGSDPEARLQPRMLYPRYWSTWILLGSLWLVSWLPRGWIMGMGNWIGDRIRLSNRKRRGIVETNLRLCFPDLSDREREQMLVDHFRCYGCGLLDMGLIMMATRERIEKHSSVEGRENLVSNLDNPGVIMITFHTTTLDMCSSSMCSSTMMADIPVVTMMKRDRNPVLNRFLYRARTRYSNARVYMRDQSLRGILKGMSEGRVCYIVPDEDFGAGRHSVYAPFFGQPRAMLNIVSRFAARTGARVVPCLCRLDRSTGRYVTTLLPPLENFPGKSEVEDATRINQAMESLISKAPEQYLWTFRWFKTRPEGLDSPYP